MHDHLHSAEAHPLKHACKTQLHLHAVVPKQIPHICTQALCIQHTSPHTPRAPALTHNTPKQTSYKHTVNLTPCSNAERIMPGLEDIKSLDYPIKSHSTPPPHTQNQWGKPSQHITRVGGSVHIYMCVCTCTNVEQSSVKPMSSLRELFPLQMSPRAEI